MHELRWKNKEKEVRGFGANTQQKLKAPLSNKVFGRLVP